MQCQVNKTNKPHVGGNAPASRAGHQTARRAPLPPPGEPRLKPEPPRLLRLFFLIVGGLYLLREPTAHGRQRLHATGSKPYQNITCRGFWYHANAKSASFTFPWRGIPVEKTDDDRNSAAKSLANTSNTRHVECRSEFIGAYFLYLFDKGLGGGPGLNA